jgi:hypothetical protein
VRIARNVKREHGARLRRPSMLTLGSVVLAAALLVSCGGSARPRTVTAPSRTHPALPRMRETRLDIGTPAERPPNVAAQLSFVGGAGSGACLAPSTGFPTLKVYPVGFPEDWHATNLMLGEGVTVCFLYLGSGPVHAVVQAPTGQITRETLPRNLPNDTDHQWELELPLTAPLGRYTITASDGPVLVHGTFDLSAATTPVLHVYGRDFGPDIVHNEEVPGADVTLTLAGFRSNQSLRFILYRQDGPTSSLFSFYSTAKVVMPTRGWEAVQFRIPEGGSGNFKFIVVVESGAEHLMDGFTVVSPEQLAHDYDLMTISQLGG